MDERSRYQVLAPDSVAWHIQAALVADRTGNQAARDLALDEARRIAAERRLVEQPAPDGSRVLCYDCRTTDQKMAELEKIIASLHEHQVLDARRVEKLENLVAAIDYRQWEDREAERDLAQAELALRKRVDALEAWRNVMPLPLNPPGQPFPEKYDVTPTSHS